MRCWNRVEGRDKAQDYRALQAEIERARVSILHINCQARFFNPVPFTEMLAALRRKGIQIVVQLHNLFTVAEELSSILRAADRVFVHSPENRLEAIANGAQPENVCVVPQGVLLRAKLTKETRSLLRSKLGIADEQPLLTTFGFIQAHKGLEALVEAVVHLRQRGVPARGIIIGETREDDPNSAAYLRALRNLVNTSGVSEHVTFITTFVPEEQVGEYLAASDLVIMNYRSQHFEASGACSVAIGAGAVVLTSLAPAMMAFGDAVWHLTSGYPVGLSAELILRDPKLRGEIQACAARYAEEHSWPRIAAQIREIYSSMYCSMGTASTVVKSVEESPQNEESPVTHATIPTTTSNIRVLLQSRPNTFTQRGGDTVVLERLSEGLAVRGYEVTVDVAGERNPKDYEVVHLFNLATTQLTQSLAQRAQAAGVPFVVTSLYEDLPEFHNQSHAIAATLLDYVKGGQDRNYWRAHRIDLSTIARSQRFPADWIVQNAAALFANGAGEARALKRDYPQAKSILELPLGHEVGVTCGPELFEEAYGVRDFVLCVGRLESRKNQLMLLKALESSDLTVVLAGGGFSYQPEYEQAVRSFKRRGRTIVLDRVSSQMLASAYAACKIHVLPSWYELPGLVSLEAAAHGKNIVATRTGTSEDYLGDTAFYCLPWEEDSIQAAVMAAYYAPIKDGLVAMAQSFTWEGAVQRTIEAYEQVLGLTEKRVSVSVPQTAQDSAVVSSHGFYDMSVNAMELEDAIEQGEVAAKAMNFELADEMFRKAETLDPTSARVLKGLGVLLLAQSRESEALVLFERALQYAPADPKIITGRGMCEMMLGRPKQAAPFFERALNVAPDSMVALHQLLECAYSLQQFDRAQIALERYLAIQPNDAEMRFCLAGCLYKSGELNAALRQIADVIKVKPQHEGARELELRIRADQQGNSIQPPSEPSVSVVSTETLESLSSMIMGWKVNGAQKVAVTSSAVIEEDPERTRIETEICEVEALKRSGKLEQAKEALKLVCVSTNLTQQQRECLRCLDAEFQVFSGELLEASAIYDQLLDKNPHLARALCGKGAIAAEGGEWETAQAFFETALDYMPGYDVALAGLALCKMVANQSEEAFNLFKRAAKTNPENNRAILGVLQLGYPLKRYQEMEELLTSYLDIHPASLDMIYSFAGVLYAQGKVAEARSEVEKILIVEPKHEPALELREMLNRVGTDNSVIM